ncbi:MAG: Glycosyl hydrolase family 57 [Candidatus Argoarchaeum ethanivorans]|uniref:Glycosyl hydrolase family 57 n=1 Tax=Candidatus Argoarchaeum ethanivorans TaxID=2608793 RepID=A0A811T6I0_9EURY|nr:MAG: Glycosyl hydrolase family 57 [Candidatus Argoarchaeum ethanivorans]
MKAVCLCFQVHQPFRVRWYWPREGYSRDAASVDLYFDQAFNYSVFEKVCRGYIQSNKVVGDTKLVCTFNISGTLFDQCKWHPQLIDSFKKLKGAGVEFASSPYYNSLSSLFEREDEFVRQVKMHKSALLRNLGVTSTSFINTELVHNATIARCLLKLGFSAAVSEGSDSPGDQCCYVFDDGNIPFLLRHRRLSEDVQFRFSDTNWSEYPLTAKKFVQWIDSMKGDVLTLYMDYASFGSQERGSSSLEFFSNISDEFSLHGIQLLTVADAVSTFEAASYEGDINFSRFDLKHCLSNHMQHVYFNELKRLSSMDFVRDDIFGYLQQVDILSTMDTTKKHPFDSAVNAFSILSDYARRRV